MRWSEPALLAGIAAVAALISFAGASWAIAHGRRNGLIDAPGERRSHAVATPRGGGIGLVAACGSILVLLAITQAQPLGWMWIGIGLVLVAGVGWWDDHRPLPAWPRLLAHALAGMCLAYAMRMQGADPVVIVAALVLVPVLVNAWNFMDGINGLASSQALLCAAGFAVVVGGAHGVLGWGLAAACAGFLPVNFPQARVFLGDIGSGTLGYLIACLVVAALAAQPVAGWPLLLLPVAVMLVDSGFTLLWRLHRGERWWEAHVQHAYQRWSRVVGHAPVTIAYALWTMASVAVMLVALDSTAITAGVAPGLWIATAYAWWRLHRHC